MRIEGKLDFRCHYRARINFKVFSRTFGRIGMFFSLKLSAPTGKSSLKICAQFMHRFGGIKEQIDRQTNSLSEECYIKSVVFDHGDFLGC